jgi:cytidylate kinase
MVIAIDGPAASGKSSTAAAVARVLGAYHLDSGALYRTLTRVALDAHTRDPEAILQAAARRGVALAEHDAELMPLLDGGLAESRIRSPEVTGLVSEVSAMPTLRDWVNMQLRAAARADRALVLDGRDIGTVVFPTAATKIFLTASPEARARRRLVQRGDPADEAAVAVEAARLAERDRADSLRPVAPLQRAPDATVVDTTEMSFDQQVSTIVGLIRSVLPEPS